MAKQSDNKPNISSNAFFWAAALLLILSATILVAGGAFQNPFISFGNCRLKTEIARTSSEKARGLSGRSIIPKEYAMIFPFKKEQPFFWMKDMLTSIDIVWVANGAVVKVDSNVPVDDGATTYQAPVPIDSVIEVKAGRTTECGVKDGTQITGLRS